jgi:hypothetical protein
MHKNIWEGLIAYFPLTGQRPNRKRKKMGEGAGGADTKTARCSHNPTNKKCGGYIDRQTASCSRKLPFVF